MLRHLLSSLQLFCGAVHTVYAGLSFLEQEVGGFGSSSVAWQWGEILYSEAV